MNARTKLAGIKSVERMATIEAMLSFNASKII